VGKCPVGPPTPTPPRSQISVCSTAGANSEDSTDVYGSDHSSIGEEPEDFLAANAIDHPNDDGDEDPSDDDGNEGSSHDDEEEESSHDDEEEESSHDDEDESPNDDNGHESSSDDEFGIPEDEDDYNMKFTDYYREYISGVQGKSREWEIGYIYDLYWLEHRFPPRSVLKLLRMTPEEKALWGDGFTSMRQGGWLGPDPTRMFCDCELPFMHPPH
jgi:hypothetical protein